jgi:ubiquinone/menaquinone biosynthesis C-methylase UbiE
MGYPEQERFLSLKSYRFVNYRFVFENLLKCCVKQTYLLLDAGCGRGASISYVPNAREFVSIDVLRANVIACKRRWKERSYVIADLTMLPFIEGSFDGALSADVLEHVDKKTAAINELARITRSGGFFIGCSSNNMNPVFWLDVKLPMLMKPLVMKLAGPGNYDRHSRFSPSSLNKTLDRARYRLNYLYLFGFPTFSMRTANDQPWVALSWVLFDLLTKKKPLLFLKEILVWQATKL